MGKIKVLIADDHPLLREGVRALLSTKRHLKIVGEAVDGEDVIKKASELLPDVIIMDISMPRLNGIEATQQISMENPDIKIIVLTQHTNRNYVQSSLNAGAAGCIPKEALASDLIMAIDSVCMGRTFVDRSMLMELADDRNIPSITTHNILTKRELEIVKLIGQDFSNKEIADKLYVSINTVINHKKIIMKKLQFHHKSEIVKYAIRTGLVD